MIPRPLLRLALGLAALLHPVRSLVAQTYEAGGVNTRGLHLAVHGEAATIRFSNADDWRGGAGLGGRIGWGITQRLTLFGQGDLARVRGDEAGTVRLRVGHLDLGARFTFTAPRRRWAPYVSVASSSLSFTEPAEPRDLEFEGNAIGIGGGALVFFRRMLALDLGVHLAGGRFDRLTTGNTTQQIRTRGDAASARFMAGLSWYPMAPKRETAGREGRRGGE